MKSVSEMLAVLIDKHKMTQSEIGKAVGIHQSTVCRLYTGESSSPSFAIGMKIFALYNKKEGK